MKKAALFVLTAIFLVTPLLMTACGQANIASTQTPVAVAVVLGNRQNTKKPNLNGSALTGLVQQAIKSACFISWTVVDGQPQCKNEYKISTPSTAGLSEAQINRIYTQEASSILSNMAATKAETPEADVLQAIDIASRSLSDASQGASKQLIVLDSGLSTTGALNFTTSDFLDSDPSVAIDYLTANKDIPDLSGITVTFIGLGDVSSPQQQLTGSEVANLKSIWTGIVKKGGGKVNILNSLSGETGPTTGYPTVTPVSGLTAATTSFDNSSAVVFRNILFTGDSAKYVDAQAAMSALQPVAGYMKSHPDYSILLIGTTAGDGDKDYCLNLSKARAEAVRATLISMGISGDRITAVGKGYEDEWHLPDISGGHLIESIAAQNRKVVLLNVSSAVAQAILVSNT
ncbi:MAG: OmpA family protein [Sporolactobacillus sp.]